MLLNTKITRNHKFVVKNIAEYNHNFKGKKQINFFIAMLNFMDHYQVSCPHIQCFTDRHCNCKIFFKCIFVLYLLSHLFLFAD